MYECEWCFRRRPAGIDLRLFSTGLQLLGNPGIFKGKP